MDALFRQAGVMVVHRRGAMIDVAKIAARQPLPSGPRVRVITNSATLAQQMGHTSTRWGCCGTPSRLCSARSADPVQFADAARAALADPHYDSVLCAAVNVFDLGTEDVIVALDAVAANTTKPLVGVFLDFHAPRMSGGEPDGPAGCPASTRPPMRSMPCRPCRRTRTGGTGIPERCRCSRSTRPRPAGW